MSDINLLNDGDTGLQARTIINALVNRVNTSGASGTSGTSGATGSSGVGVPTGGTSGQILSKIDGTDYNTQWVNAPTGGSGNGTSGTSGTRGTSGVAGISGVDGVNGTSGSSGTSGIGMPTGGTSGQILAKINNTDYNSEWIDAPTGGGGASFPYTGTAGITGLLAVTGKTVSGTNTIATGDYSHAEGADYINPTFFTVQLTDAVGGLDLYNNTFDGFAYAYSPISITSTELVVPGDLSAGTILPFTADYLTLYDADFNAIVTIDEFESFLINGNYYTSTYPRPVIDNITYDSGLDRSTITFSTPLQSVYAIPNTQYSAPQATGYGSHAEGVDTVALGANSHAEGVHTTSGGIGSHAEGIGTIAAGNYQHVSGQWNYPMTDEGAFIIGNGTDDANRGNSLMVYGGTVQVGGTLSVSGAAFIANNSTVTVSGTSGIKMPQGVKIGNGAGTKNLTPYNVAIGEFAMSSSTSGEGNISIGTAVMSNAISGNNNIGLGSFALQNIGTSSNNIAIGQYTLSTSNDGTSGSNIAIGSNAGQIARGGLNTYIGSASGKLNSSGNGNTGVGQFTVGADTNGGQPGSTFYTGSNNTALGKGALRSNASGNTNIAIGVDALVNSRTVNNNIAVGNNTMYNTYNNHSDTIAIGNNILYTTQFGQYNIILGHEASRYDSGGSNIAQTNNSIHIGYDTRGTNNASNEIVIGHTTIGNGSNSITLGNTSIARTQLRGQVVFTPQSSAPTGIEGAIYYNSVSKKHFGFNGTAWTALY